MAKSVDLDETAYYEPFYQDLPCLQILLFSSLALKVLMYVNTDGHIKKRGAARCLIISHLMNMYAF